MMKKLIYLKGVLINRLEIIKWSFIPNNSNNNKTIKRLLARKHHHFSNKRNPHNISKKNQMKGWMNKMLKNLRLKSKIISC